MMSRTATAMPDQPKKPYRDVFGNPLTKKDVKATAILMARTGDTSAMNVMRQLKIGYGKANRLVKLMYDAGIAVDSTLRGTVILKNEEQAVNAALRQLKKGNKK